jgi:hypothetical protein
VFSSEKRARRGKKEDWSEIFETLGRIGLAQRQKVPKKDAADALEKCMLAVLCLERFLMDARVEGWLGTQGVRQGSGALRSE